MPVWSKYGIRLPSRSLKRPAHCERLTEIYHVAHAPDAIRIIEDKMLKARPVYDQSRLNRTRTHVTLDVTERLGAGFDIWHRTV